MDHLPIPKDFLLTSPRSSGIGRAVAILFAREGADVTIVYLPEEQKDADGTKKGRERGQGVSPYPG